MKNTLIIILSFLFFTNCKNSEDNERFELVPEPDKHLNPKYINKKKSSQIVCDFSYPDTSLSGIKIGNVESVLEVLGKKTKLQGDSTHIFYSKNKEQELRLTIHPGSAFSQVSIINVSYSKKIDKGYKTINKIFQSEKGIKLGMNKSEIIERLGNCYVAKDSTKENIQLNYRIETPNDSKTKLLQSNNMPFYYAWYKFKNDKLENFEFGFEYP